MFGADLASGLEVVIFIVFGNVVVLKMRWDRVIGGISILGSDWGRIPICQNVQQVFPNNDTSNLHSCVANLGIPDT